LAEVSFEVVSIVAMGKDLVEVTAFAPGDVEDCLTIVTSNLEYVKTLYIGSVMKFAGWMSESEREKDPLYKLATAQKQPPRYYVGVDWAKGCSPTETKSTAQKQAAVDSQRADAPSLETDAEGFLLHGGAVLQWYIDAAKEAREQYCESLAARAKTLESLQKVEAENKSLRNILAARNKEIETLTKERNEAREKAARWERFAHGGK